ncbi:MAG: hypothetical protein JWM02_1683 [Frankiales bacterium]|nr:hypothetical protein [Frankiales bacterium]
MRRRTTALLTCTATLALTAGLGSALSAATAAPSGQEASNAQRFTFGLFGDMPYGDLGHANYPNVLADMNTSNLAFSVFDGDTKNGSDPCYAKAHSQQLLTPDSFTPENAVADATHPDVYHAALDSFAQLKDPVVYVPGDNEWTDCDRTKLVPKNQSDSYDRLQYLRALSYPTDQSLGQRTMTLTRQSAAYPENTRWTHGPVTYLTLNIPGSNNNWLAGTPDTQPEGAVKEAQAEYTARNAANLAWIKAGFAQAKAAGSKGVVITIQADMWDPAAGAANLDHYADTKKALFTETTAYSGQVLLVNGDSHSFTVDKPLTDYATTNAGGKAGANAIENFTRLTTFGEFQDHWVSVDVNPQDPQLFEIHQHVIAANVPTYTPPAG